MRQNTPLDLRALAVDVHTSAFIASLVKDISMERAKVKQTDAVRVLVLMAFFLEFFLLVHKDDKTRRRSAKQSRGTRFR